MGTSDGAGAQLSAAGRPPRPGGFPGGNLMPLEEELVAGAAAGKLVDRGDGPFDLAEMRRWGEERTVRAAVLRHLLVTRQWPLHAKGVQLRGVRIDGHLDLEGATLRCPLLLESCYLDASEAANLKYAAASSVTLIGCRLAGFTGEMLTAKALTLSCSTFTGPLRLAGVSVAGSFRCSGAQLTGRDEDGYALSAARVKVGGDVFLDEGFTAAGAVELGSADIAGSLSCSGAQLTGRDEDGYALSAYRVKVGDVFLDEGFTASAVELAGADIAGSLSCSGAQLTGRDEDGNALSAAGIKVSKDVFLGDGFTAAGAVELGSAEIAGSLSCSGAQLTGRDEDGIALSAARVKVGGDVFLGDGFTAAGAVELGSAEIAGSLSCSGAQLTGRDEDGYAPSAYKSGYALSAYKSKVGDVFLGEGFTASAVELAGAEIAGSLSCSGAQLTGRDEDGYALTAAGIKVGGDVHLGDGFTAEGGISLISARLSGSLEVMPTRLAGNEEDADQDDDDEEEVSLDASNAQITGALHWLPAEQVRGQVNLEGAAAGELKDDWTSCNGWKNGHWPCGGRLNLDGFTYVSLGGYERTSADQRLTWIRSQYRRSDTSWQGFATQPYEQLAAVYRHAGQDDQARKVAIARRADLRKYGNLNRYRRFGNWFLDWSIKYGYQTWRAATGLAALFVVFLALSILAQHQHAIVPIGEIEGLHPAPSVTQCMSNYPCFYPVGYTIDTVIPIINVHQTDYWGPDGHAPWGWAWLGLTWVVTGLGWALATLLVAGYTGLVRRD